MPRVGGSHMRTTVPSALREGLHVQSTERQERRKGRGWSWTCGDGGEAGT